MSPRPVPLLLTGLALLAGVGWSCGEEPVEPRFVCEDPGRVARLKHVQYPDHDCEAATTLARSRLQSAHYRRACEQLAPIEGLPGPALAARVTRCEADVQGGSRVDVEICCPE